MRILSGSSTARASKLSPNAKNTTGYSNSEAGIIDLDSRQKIVEGSPWRSTRIITDIAAYDVNTAEGWYWVNNPTAGGNLDGFDQQLVELVSGDIANTYTPVLGDEIKIGVDRHVFDGSNFVNQDAIARDLQVQLKSIGGQYIGSANTYSTLPRTQDHKDGSTSPIDNGDWCYLSTDDIGTGTEEAPQYPKGVYSWSGSSYDFSFAVGSDAVELELATLITGTEEVPKLIAAKTLDDWKNSLAEDFQSPFWVEPVIAKVDTLPDINTLNEGDRYLLASRPPAIRIVSNGVYTSEPFVNNATVKDSLGNTWQHQDNDLLRLVSIVKKDRPPTSCDKQYQLGTEWDHNGDLYKAIAFKIIGTTSSTLGRESRTGSRRDVNAGTQLWQSFTPETTGGLSFAIAGLFNAPEKAKAIFRLYAGQGIDGKLLYEETTNFITSFSPKLKLSCNPVVEANKQYTWSLEKPSSRDLGFSVYQTVDYLPGELANESPNDYAFLVDISPVEGTTWLKLEPPIPPIADDFYKVLTTGVVSNVLPQTGTEGDVILLVKPSDPDAIAIYSGGSWSEQSLEVGDTYLVAADSTTEANSVAVVGTDLNFDFVSPESARVIFQAESTQFYTWKDDNWTPLETGLKKATEDKVFYVSNSGSNDNPGTASEPFLNFTRASLTIASEWDFCGLYDCKILALDDLIAGGNFNVIYSPRGIKSNKGIEIGSVDPDNIRSITFRRDNGFTVSDSAVWIQSLNIVGDSSTLRGVIRFGSKVTLDNVTFSGIFNSCIYGQNSSEGRFGDIYLDNITAENINFADGLTIDEWLGTVTFVGTNTVATAIFRGQQKSAIYLRNNFNLDSSSGSIIGREFQLREQAVYGTDKSFAQSISLFETAESGRLYGSSVALNLASNRRYSNLIIGSEITQAGRGAILNIPELYYEIYDDSDRTVPFWERVYQPSQQITIDNSLLNQDRQLFIVASATGVELIEDFTFTEFKRDRLYLGVVEITQGAIAPPISFLIENNPTNGSSDLLFYGGIVNRAIAPFPKSGTRNFSLPAGNLEVVGSNYFTDASNPHQYAIAETDVVLYDLYAPDGTLITANETELDFSRYWDGTAVRAVEGNDASVVHFYYSPYREGRKVVGIIGTVAYTSITVAKRDWRDTEQHTPPAWLEQPNKLILAVVGRVDYVTADQTARVSFNANLDFQGSALGGGTSTTQNIATTTTLVGLDKNIYQGAIVTGNTNPDVDGFYVLDANNNWRKI